MQDARGFIKEGGLLQDVLATLMDCLSHGKREVRDAGAQALGGLSNVLGDAIFAELIPLLRSPSGVAAMEGYMMCIGYVVSKNYHISSANFVYVVCLMVVVC